MNDATRGIFDTLPFINDAFMPSPSVILAPSMIIDLFSSRYVKLIHKSTKLPSFSYSYYFLSLTSLLTSLHNLCERTSYTEAIFFYPNVQYVIVDLHFSRCVPTRLVRLAFV